MPDSVYLTSLHKFISEYFISQGAEIRILNEDFFQVNFSDGKTQTYTYKPRIASENRSVELLAKGSRALKSIMDKCRNESMLAQAEVRYTAESVEQSVSENTCCNLCPYFQVCEDKRCCCDFCGYYKVCNSYIQNASFDKLGLLKESSPVTFLAYVFLATISNDYNLHLKTQLRVMVLLSYPDGEVFDDIVVKKLEQLEFDPAINPVQIEEHEWEKFNQKAKEALRIKLNPYLNMFRYQSENPLQEKVTSILNKYSEEYSQNFTSFSSNKLEKLQDVALAYCERELRGFAVNCECRMENAFVIHTAIDKRELIFKVNDMHVSLDGEIFLNKVAIHCSQCGLEIDKGYLCNNGHVLCSSCSDICTDCEKLICPLCDEEAELCEVCGETVCKNCASSCSSCDSITCDDHHFPCKKCGKDLCFDCIELCSVCSAPYCPEHINYCSQCEKALCEEHTITCDTCGIPLCPEHTRTCDVCNVALCDEHAFLSSTGSVFTCKEHLTSCTTCNKAFSVSEVSTCTQCGTHICSEHRVLCSQCGKSFCTGHVTICPGCGKAYCSCTAFRSCIYCGVEYCPSCLDSRNTCTGCQSLKRARPDSSVIELLSARDLAWGKYKNFYTGDSGQITVILASSFINPRIAVIHKDRGIIADKKIKWLDYVKLISLRRPK